MKDIGREIEGEARVWRHLEKPSIDHSAKAPKKAVPDYCCFYLTLVTSWVCFIKTQGVYYGMVTLKPHTLSYTKRMHSHLQRYEESYTLSSITNSLSEGNGTNFGVVNSDSTLKYNENFGRAAHSNFISNFALKMSFSPERSCMIKDSGRVQS